MTMYVMWRWQLCIFRIRFRIDIVGPLSPLALVENQATRLGYEEGTYSFLKAFAFVSLCHAYELVA